MGSAGRNRNTVTRSYLKPLVAQGHQPFSGGDVIDLFRPEMPMQCGAGAWLNPGLGQALSLVAVHCRVHQFTDLRAVLRFERGLIPIMGQHVRLVMGRLGGFPDLVPPHCFAPAGSFVNREPAPESGVLGIKVVSGLRLGPKKSGHSGLIPLYFGNILLTNQ
jgi:hypothetical protein